jgi:hypothetical protein
VASGSRSPAGGGVGFDTDFPLRGAEDVSGATGLSELSQFFLNKKPGSGGVEGGGKEEGISYTDG